MANILLHKTQLHPDIEEALKAHGVLPIQTDDLDSFRFLALENGPIRTDDFLWATLNALMAANSDTSKGARALVANLAALSDVEQQKKRDAEDQAKAVSR